MAKPYPTIHKNDTQAPVQFLTKNGQAMVLRWAASAFLITEKDFRKIQGYRATCGC